MPTLAVIGTFHGRHEKAFPLMHRLFVDATRKPDEAWLMCENESDADSLRRAFRELTELELLDGQPDQARIVVLPTPRYRDGSCVYVPYSRKINAALSVIGSDLVVYLDNGSIPGPDKYRVMALALEQHPEWGAVYCGQHRTGYLDEKFYASEVIERANGRLNYTQVMHRRSPDRWSTDMKHAKPDIVDGLFWDAINARFGPIYPVGGDRLHDFHHMPSPHAEGL